jgi:hypothetical protein
MGVGVGLTYSFAGADEVASTGIALETAGTAAEEAAGRAAEDSTEGVLEAAGTTSEAKLNSGRTTEVGLGRGTTPVPTGPEGLVEVMKPVGPAG